MTAYSVKTQLTSDGNLTLEGLPFQAGDMVEVIVQEYSIEPSNAIQAVFQGLEIDSDDDNRVAAYMEKQAELFDEMKATLLSEYEGQYIWFEDGVVLDADVDEECLVLRAFEQTGPRPLFVKHVLSQEPDLSIHVFSAHSLLNQG